MAFAEMFKLKNNSGKVVVDLDAIIQESSYIKLHGKTHEIKPVLVGEFWALANALAAIKDIEQTEKVTLDQLVDTYFGIIVSVCPTITKDDIRECSQSQIGGLIQHVMDHVNGKITDEKKKTMTLVNLPMVSKN